MGIISILKDAKRKLSKYFFEYQGGALFLQRSVQIVHDCVKTERQHRDSGKDAAQNMGQAQHRPHIWKGWLTMCHFLASRITNINSLSTYDSESKSILTHS